MDTITKMLNIIILQDVSTNTISRDKGIMQLIDFDLPSQETRFVKSIIQLMGKLHRNPISNDTNESELFFLKKNESLNEAVVLLDF